MEQESDICHEIDSMGAISFLTRAFTEIVSSISARVKHQLPSVSISQRLRPPTDQMAHESIEEEPKSFTEEEMAEMNEWFASDAFKDMVTDNSFANADMQAIFPSNQGDDVVANVDLQEVHQAVQSIGEFDNSGTSDLFPAEPNSLSSQIRSIDPTSMPAPPIMQSQMMRPPPMLEPSVANGPVYHPAVGWFFPAQPGSALTTPVSANFPSGSRAPYYSRPASDSHSRNSTPKPQKPRGRAKYGPAAFFEAQAKGRVEAQRGRSDQLPPPSFTAINKPVTPHPLRDRKNPPIVQSCVCTDKQVLKIKRPKNAFILYRAANSKAIIDSIGGVNDNQRVSKIAGQRWQNESPSVVQKFKKLAAEEKMRHEDMYPDYKYQPGQSKRIQFGSVHCSCGAYAANLAALRKKDAIEAFTDDTASAVFRGYMPAPSQKQQDSLWSAQRQSLVDVEEDISAFDFSAFDFSTPPHWAQAPVFPATHKRKRSMNAADAEEYPVPKRRSSRNRKSTVNYYEADVSSDNLTEPEDIVALSAEQAGFEVDCSGPPAHNTRSNSIGRPSWAVGIAGTCDTNASSLVTWDDFLGTTDFDIFGLGDSA